MASTADSEKERPESSDSARVHFKIGSRKSKLAMVQSEYIAARLKSLYPDFTFEIVNFDTRGDMILNVALPKIGDKGLFTKELEDGLENGTIDFVVHSLKDMPCQTLPERLIIAGVPEREDPSDALVIADRWRETKKCLDDLEPGMCVGTSSLRRIAQLKMKYPHLKFETIRGNLQTRFGKLDPVDAEAEKKYDAMILATAGLKRMKYDDRITQILEPDVCIHAVSQGALGVECRRDDLTVISMLNRLNDENTLLQCIAERTFLAKLEGGCSAPIAAHSGVTENSIWLEGAVFDLEGTKRIQDRFEIKFDQDNCPVVNMSASCLISNANQENSINTTSSSKRKLDDDEDEEKEEKDVETKKEEDDKSKNVKKVKRVEKEVESKPEENKPLTSAHPLLKSYSFIVDMNIRECRMIKAELCGLHLAEKLKERGADVLISEIKAQIHKSF